MTDNFWIIPSVDGFVTPYSILSEIGQELTDRTNGNLIGHVEKSTMADGEILMTLFIVVPNMNNYRFRIVAATHGVLLYPVTVFVPVADIRIEIPDSQALRDKMKEALSTPEVQRVVSSLLAQAT